MIIVNPIMGLKCPLCNSPTRLVMEKDDRGNWFRVECSNCNCSSNRRIELDYKAIETFKNGAFGRRVVHPCGHVRCWDNEPYEKQIAHEDPQLKMCPDCERESAKAERKRKLKIFRSSRKRLINQFGTDAETDVFLKDCGSVIYFCYRAGPDRELMEVSREFYDAWVKEFGN